MNQDQLNQIMVKTVALTCDKLSDIELATLNTTVQLDEDPHGRLFDYEIVKGLFTERNGTRMHEETKIALANVVNTRLGKK